MSDLAKMALERKSVAFVLGLGSLLALVVNHHIDGGNFATCFVGLVASFMGAVAYQEKS